ncbi:hypothetical protein BJV82DRAFT_633075 [Fennellomyces sp. T-0311]|nr:hypothetical protein BJV82DRAFT_633075 [Fennellomyces sp. T-0311]
MAWNRYVTLITLTQPRPVQDICLWCTAHILHFVICLGYTRMCPSTFLVPFSMDTTLRFFSSSGIPDRRLIALSLLVMTVAPAWLFSRPCLSTAAPCDCSQIGSAGGRYCSFIVVFLVAAYHRSSPCFITATKIFGHNLGDIKSFCCGTPSLKLLLRLFTDILALIVVRIWLVPVPPIPSIAFVKHN